MAVKQAIYVIIIAVFTYNLLGYLQGDEFDAASLTGKNVVVVGASSGIGEQMAYWYAGYGANVFITARRENRLKQVVAHCETLVPSGGSQIGYVAADMSVEEDRSLVIQSALEFFGGDIDQLVLNHAYMSPVHTWNGSEVQLAHLKGILNVNVVSFVHLTALALPSLKRTSGSVAVVSSITGRCPFPFTLEYQASKFALDGFFSGLRFEFKATKQNVSITYCTIGLIDTESGMIALRNVVNKFSDPSEMLLKLFMLAKPDDTARAIISATTQRKGELYYPGYQLLWLQAVIRSMFPQLFEMLDFKYKPES